MVQATTEECLTTQEAAGRLRVSDETVRTWVKSGKLAGTLVGQRAGFRIPAAAVEALLAGSTATAATADQREDGR